MKTLCLWKWFMNENSLEVELGELRRSIDATILSLRNININTLEKK